MKSPVIYLDNNATTPIDCDVYQAMLPSLQNSYGNPSSRYSLGYMAKQEIQEARHSVANLLHAQTEQIVFTSGATEANSTAIIGSCLKDKSKDHIITSMIEHPAILEACHFLQERHGFKISYVPVDHNGIVEARHIRALITIKTSLIAVMMVNNEVGSIQPIKEIGTICNEKQIHFHCDAVQGAGKLHIDVQDLNVDTLSVSAHKFYGPKGIGCLYIKDVNKLNPLLHGGSQEKGLRSGTENVSGIVGFGVAAKNALRNKEVNNKKITKLRNLFLKGLSENLVDWQINGNHSVPSTLSISFSGVRGEALAFALDQIGVCVSVASACSSSSSKLSHVLVSMGKSNEEIRSTIRVSIGKQNTSEEITTAVRAISSTVNKLRSFSNKFRTVKANASGEY